jgi:hypothetical protein
MISALDYLGIIALRGEENHFSGVQTGGGVQARKLPLKCFAERLEIYCCSA